MKYQALARQDGSEKQYYISQLVSAGVVSMEFDTLMPPEFILAKGSISIVNEQRRAL